MKLAYTIRGAAKATALSDQMIVSACRSGALKIRKTGEHRTDPIIILVSDLQAWLESLPPYVSANIEAVQ
ncbi:hypothetical protein BH09ACT6_BH09ACT6_05910 [soil metagenome]